MSHEVYQMPASDQHIGPADVFDFLNWWSDEAADIAPLLNSFEARKHMLSVAQYLRWAAAAERSAEVS